MSLRGSMQSTETCHTALGFLLSSELSSPVCDFGGVKNFHAASIIQGVKSWALTDSYNLRPIGAGIRRKYSARRRLRQDVIIGVLTIGGSQKLMENSPGSVSLYDLQM
ncbi:hypothetical protein R1flu_023597 [Riccia fluitans]|uniref:Uncharacterized protein n=1 Tax=Riccia fluitans TaxID=41844 RepID=A0ABD1XSZ1_9MARC